MQQAGHVKAFPKVSSEVLVYTNCYNLKTTEDHHNWFQSQILQNEIFEQGVLQIASSAISVSHKDRCKQDTARQLPCFRYFLSTEFS
jgi:hypothetical protein